MSDKLDDEPKFMDILQWLITTTTIEISSTILRNEGKIPISQSDKLDN